MALSAIETSRITNELTTALTTVDCPTIRDVMITAGVAGEAAKAVDVVAVVTTVLSNLYGQAEPTILP